MGRGIDTHAVCCRAKRIGDRPEVSSMPVIIVFHMVNYNLVS